MKSGWTCHILHHPLWPLPHKWIWHGKCNNKFWTQTPSPEACIKAITIECTPFNTCETFSYLIYFQGNLEIWFVKSIGCFQMYPHMRGHTNSQLPSVCDYLSVFPCQYTVSAGPPLSIDQKSWFPYDLKASELLSVQLNSSASCFFKSPDYLFLYFSCSEED